MYDDFAPVDFEFDLGKVDFADSANVAANLDDGSFDFDVVELIENRLVDGTATIDWSVDVAEDADAASVVA